MSYQKAILVHIPKSENHIPVFAFLVLAFWRWGCNFCTTYKILHKICVVS